MSEKLCCKQINKIMGYTNDLDSTIIYSLAFGSGNIDELKNNDDIDVEKLSISEYEPKSASFEMLDLTIGSDENRGVAAKGRILSLIHIENATVSKKPRMP